MTRYARMRIPDLKRIRQEHQHEPKILRWCSPLHPNPRVWKHTWRLFTRYSTSEGDAFLRSPREALCTAEAMNLLARYRESGETVWIYGSKMPRRDPAACPFDPDHPKWRNTAWAPPFDEDPDPVWLDAEGVAYK